MQISSRFSIAVHILLAVDKFGEAYKVTSEFLAGSVGVNPVIVRKILGCLKRAGLVDVTAGTGGARLLRSAERISLLDIYRAVDPLEKDNLFSFHGRPNGQCPVGRSIHAVLDVHIESAQQAMEHYLGSVSLKNLGDGVR